MAWEHPQFIDGKKAYKEGKRKTDNPYDVGTINYQQWSSGFKRGEYENYNRGPGTTRLEF
jgi:hypothetical protein